MAFPIELIIPSCWIISEIGKTIRKIIDIKIMSPPYFLANETKRLMKSAVGFE